MCISYRSTDYGQTFVDESSRLLFGSVLHDIIYRFPNSKAVSLDTYTSFLYDQFKPLLSLYTILSYSVYCVVCSFSLSNLLQYKLYVSRLP